jgi:hypothetical protein
MASVSDCAVLADSGSVRPRGETLRHPTSRYAVYALVGLLLLLLAVVATSCKRQFDFIVSDGRYYYVYLSSLVIDGDLDFSNQMREHWGNDYCPDPNKHVTQRGLVANIYPIGVALTLAPSFLVGHALAHTCHACTGAAWCLPDGYSLPYQLSCLVFLLMLATATMALTDRLLTEVFHVDPLLTTLAVVLYWLGSPLLYYTFREPFMAHGPGAFWVTCVIYLIWRLLEGLERGILSPRYLFLLVFAASMTLVCRYSNGCLAPLYGYFLFRMVRTGAVLRLVRCLPAALAGLFPFGVQALAWHELHGQWFMSTHSGLGGFHWTSPALWQTLFSSRHGLFFWSPLLLVSAGGLIWRLRNTTSETRPFLGWLLGAFLLLWYINSSWCCWWFGDSFGGRAFLELGFLFVLGLASAFEAMHCTSPASRRAFAAGIVVLLLYHFALMSLYILHLIPRDDFLL